MLGLAALLLPGLTLPVVAGATLPSGLHGHVRIGPTTPVCRVDIPCSKPAAGVTISFTRNARVTRVKTGLKGGYSVRLAPGRYRVRSNVGLSIRPAEARVVEGKVLSLNFSIDTGIR
jgi:hypothetical protein